MYGDGNGNPTATRPEGALPTPASDTGRAEPAVQPDHYGPSSGDEYAMIKDQLECHGLFTVEPAVHRVGDLLRRARQRRLPGLPARLVPRLLRRRQLPHAVLPTENFLGNHYENPRSPS